MDLDGVNPSEQRLAVLNEIAHIAIGETSLHEMLQAIVDVLRARFGWDFVGCALIDWEAHESVCAAVSATMSTEIRPGYRLSLKRGVVGQVARIGLPVYLLDGVPADEALDSTAPGKQGELCVPIRHSDQVLAALDIVSRLPGGLHDQTIFLETVGELIAGAILGARRREELAQHAELMEVLSEVSRLALDTEDLHQSLQQLVNYIATAFPVEICSILLLNEAGTHFEVEAYSGSMKLALRDGDEWPVTVGVCGRAVREGTPQLITDVHADPDYVIGNKAIQSEYIVPIRFRTRILGCLNLESARRDCFTEYNRKVFCHLADQLAGALNLSALNHSLAELSFIDHLTGIANRRRFDDVLAAECRRAARTGRSLAVLLADADAFKQLNDRYGHEAGDDCLRRMATALRRQLREDVDLVARYGGEEFAVLLPETDVAGAYEIAERLREAVVACGIEHAASPVADVATVSIGVAAWIPDVGSDPRVLVRLADGALYRAKREGRNRVVAADDLSS